VVGFGMWMTGLRGKPAKLNILKWGLGQQKAVNY
jgi:hypothetical protein